MGKFLGLVNIHSSTAKLPGQDEKIWASLRVEGGIHSTDPPREDAQDPEIFLSEAGALYVLSKCRKSRNKLNALADILGVKIHKNKWLFKEQDSLQNIIDVLKGEEMLTQFNVDGYRIDLYFPAHRLAIKCDEFGHNDRGIECNVWRQKYIENKLGCQFIRFNPDARGFNIFEVANRIFSCI